MRQIDRSKRTATKFTCTQNLDKNWSNKDVCQLQPPGKDSLHLRYVRPLCGSEALGNSQSGFHFQWGPFSSWASLMAHLVILEIYSIAWTIQNLNECISRALESLNANRHGFSALVSRRFPYCGTFPGLKRPGRSSRQQPVSSTKLIAYML